MGRRRRKIVRLPKRSLPKVFLCPKCGEDAVRVIMGGKEATAVATCGKCGLRAEIQTNPNDEPVDVYCKLTDKFYAKELV